ncbi:MAG: hypothetical protein ACQET5_11605 [Halobacteriota archaeon]|uniref:hypothetical protein n=1 Tax=Natronomonas sp. TaxID=2184060 RepID=UPI00397575FE
MDEPQEMLDGVADVDHAGKQPLVIESTSEIGGAAALALGLLGADVDGIDDPLAESAKRAVND